LRERLVTDKGLTPEECREKAADAAAKAQAAEDPEERIWLLELAEAYRAYAKKLNARNPDAPSDSAYDRFHATEGH
jgi:hypothetical protein